MFPIVSIFGKTVTTYALLAIAGGLLCGFLFCRRIRKRGLDDNEAIVFLLICALGSLIGGHLLYALTNLQFVPVLLAAKDPHEAIAALNLIFGGSVFYGGLLGAIAAGFAVIRIRKLNAEIYLDEMAPLVPLFHAVARVGCFLGGCCYGIACPIGFTAHGNPLVPAVNDVCRFPVQLLESLCNLILFIVLYRLLLCPKTAERLRGRFFYLYLAAYAVIRFSDEFLRGDEIRGFVLGLSTSQFISILVLIAALIGWITKRKKAAK